MKVSIPVIGAMALLAWQSPPATGPAAAQEAGRPDRAASRGPDVMYVPTPEATVDAMLKLAEVRAGDVLYDLGSGDGRIPIAAAKQFGIRAVGIEIDPQLVSEAKANAKAAGVADKVTFRREDLFQADIREATVVTLYLLPRLNEQLMPKLLRDLKPGTRIVSHVFPMGSWKPEQTIDVSDTVIHRWTVPQKTRPAS